jgi:type IX secretion system PorP/SprF family membrane protein
MNMRRLYKKIVISFFVMYIGISMFQNASAQQDPMYSMYMFNTLSVNPAYAGSKEILNALALTRNQWVGIDGAPKTQSLTIHAPFMRKNLGLGFSYVRDVIGPDKENMVYLDFAYRLKINEGSYLSMGLKGGFNLFSSNLLSLDPIETGDAALVKDIKNQFMPNFGFGLYYFTEHYYLGLSTPRLLKNELGKNDVSNSALGTQERHTFFIAGYVKDLNPVIKFKPTVMLKYVYGAPLSIDLSANFLFNEALWVGAFVRIGDSFGAIVQYKINDQLSIGYAYDYTTSELRKYNSGSHEFMLSYDFLFRKAKIKSPRYF